MSTEDQLIGVKFRSKPEGRLQTVLRKSETREDGYWVVETTNMGLRKQRIVPGSRIRNAIEKGYVYN